VTRRRVRRRRGAQAGGVSCGEEVPRRVNSVGCSVWVSRRAGFGRKMVAFLGSSTHALGTIGLGAWGLRRFEIALSVRSC